MIAAEETDQQHDDHFTQTEWVEAGWMYLRNEPKSDEAKALVDTILAGLPLEPARPTTVARRRVALGALLADLLRLAEEGQVGCHGMNRDDFPLKRLGFAYDIFRSLKDAMIEAGLLWFSEGRQRLTTIGPVDGSSSRITNTSGGYVSRFRLTPDALEWIAASGVFPGDWKANWKASATLQSKGEPQPERASLVLLRASSERENGTSRSGKDLKVDPSEPVVRDMLDDLEAHNAFLTAVGVTGIDFIGLRRIFNEGDIAVKRWRSGGRFYSVRVKGMGNSYETMDGEERRALIRLGGSVVGEVDMSASQFRLLYALLDADLPSDLATDPYALPGLDREAVKLVVAQALGKAQGRSTRWGKEARKGYEKKRPGRSLQKDHNFKHYQEKVLAAHPILEGLDQPEVPAALGLQYHESEIIRRAMASLRSMGIASLPVHDSLIVPIDHLDDAGIALKEAFQAHVELVINKPTKHRAVVSPKGS